LKKLLTTTTAVTKLNKEQKNVFTKKVMIEKSDASSLLF